MNIKLIVPTLWNFNRIITKLLCSRDVA